MSNHRGITITSVIGKVLEHTLVGRIKNILRDHQHHLQFGFTEKLSPSMAALVCTEVLANNKDRSQDTYVATVDVQKAFDSVWHDSVLRKMFFATDGDTTCPLFAQLMRNISVRVRIGAERSRTVTLHQGVGQGRIPSNEQCKLHLNDLLCTLETSSFGSHIGPSPSLQPGSPHPDAKPNSCPRKVPQGNP